MAWTKSTPYSLNSHYIQHMVVELCIPRFKNVVLDLNKVQYTCWSTLFRDTARAYNLLHHIDPTISSPKLPDTVIKISKRDDITQDAVVLTWIYATISPYLLVRLLTKKCTTAMDAWARLLDMCQQHDPATQKKRKFIQIDLNEDYWDFEDTNDDRVDLISNLPVDAFSLGCQYIQHMVVESCVPRFKNVVLDLYKVQFTCWSTLFRDTARAYKLLHHIDPTIATRPEIDISIDDGMITQDAVVLAWIYATISPYLLARLLTQKSCTTAMDVWARLQDMCQQHDTAMQKKKRFTQIDLHKDYQGLEDTNDDHVDYISYLPDDVLIYMLSLANDIKTVGRTSLLSKRWTHVWTNLMDLDFDDPVTIATLKSECRRYSEMDKFVDRVFVDRVNRVISANRAPYLNTFRIHFPLNSSYAVYIQNWINFAFAKEVRNLVLIFGLNAYPRINFSNIFTSNPALILNTTLKTLHLKSVTIIGPLLQWVLTNCLNLQCLSVHKCGASPDDAASSKHHQKLVVSSLTVKHLEFVNCLKLLNIKALHLSAPNLTSIIFHEYEIDVEYHSIPSLVDATFGGSYFPHLDTLSSFYSQLEKLSIEWYKVYSTFSGFPTFVNVQQLEIVVGYPDVGLIKSTSLIEACPSLHTFKLKMMICDTQIKGLPGDAQINAMYPRQHLKTVEYAVYAGSASAAELALCLTRYALMLKRFIFDTRQPEFCTSDNKGQMAIARNSAWLAKRIQRSKGHVDVVIL